MNYWELYDKRQPFSALIGKALESVIVNENRDEIRFTTTDGDTFLMYHSQDCCECVSIEDICGDIEDIIGAPILAAEEVISCDGERDSLAEPDGWKPYEYQDSYTWAFYKLDTAKGGITIRWFGSSNGYYSERVDFALEASASDSKGE